MKLCIRSFVLLSVLIGLTAAAARAQSSDIAAPTTQTLSDLQPDALLEAARQIVQAIDRSEERGLWHLASTVVVSKIGADEFFKGVVQQRAGLGSATHRQWIDLSMQHVAERLTVPQGQYANCTFSTDFSNGRHVDELVTLHLDADHVWRFTGYVLR